MGAEEQRCGNCYHWRVQTIMASIGDLAVSGEFLGCTIHPAVHENDGPCFHWDERDKEDPVVEEEDPDGIGDMAREIIETIGYRDEW